MGDQLEFRLPNPPFISLEGLVDSHGFKYIGNAAQQFDGTWRCMADVCGALCLVEVVIKFDVSSVTKAPAQSVPF